MTRALCLLCPVLFLATSAVAADKKAPETSAAAPAAPAAPKPPVLKPRFKSETIEYRVTIRPGVPEPGQTVSVEVELAEILKVPDPAYGNRKPINDANMRGILVGSPEKGRKAKRSGPFVETRKALRLKDSGTYGFTFTAPSKGVYGLYLRGDAGSAGPIDFKTAIPYGVWPLPEGQSLDTPPPPPDKEGDVLSGDLAHGRALCDERCKTDVPAALPKGKTPTFIASDFAAGLSDDQLLAQMVKEGGPKLTALERNNLLFYLHGLYSSVADFFPEAGYFLSHSFTVNEYGKKRLLETLKLKLGDEQGTATVFVAYQGDNNGNGPQLLDYDDRVARDRLKRSDKVGYLVFLTLPKEPKAKELAIAMEREPTYTIHEIRERRQRQGRSGAQQAAEELCRPGPIQRRQELAQGPARPRVEASADLSDGGGARDDVLLGRARVHRVRRGVW